MILKAMFIVRYWKPITIAIIITSITFIFIPIFLMAAFLPEGGENTVQRYADTANELGLSWQDLIAFDIVLYENELMDRDPEDSAMYFIDLRYEEFRPASSECVKEEEGECLEVKYYPERVTKAVNARGYDEVKSFYKRYGNGQTLKGMVDSINNSSNRRILISPISADEAMIDAGFSKLQKDEFYDIQKSGVLLELFPEYGDFGLIPGVCVNDVSPDGKAKVNAAVESYSSLIIKYATQYGVSQYTEIIKAIMMAESGGSGGDPMQASEGKFANSVSSCVGKKGAARIGCITDPEDSIKAGVQEFKAAIHNSNYDIAVAIQSYNFGPYFATWIRENGGKYTVELATKYSNTVMASAGQGLGTPTHAQKVLTQFYQDPGCVAGTISTDMIGANDWVWPTQSKRITSGFGPRKSPCVGCSNFHPAIDIGAVRPGIQGDPVWSMADGVVITTQNHKTAGNSVYVDHGNGIVSRYIHLQRYTVHVGQKVTKGQIIGHMGNTGIGTATHLDFQIKINGNPVDPRPLFPNIK